MKKSILSPLCSGLVIPGLGQVLNRHLKKGLILLLIILGLFIALVVKLYGLLKFIVEHPQNYTVSPEGIMNALNTNAPLPFYIIIAIFLGIWIYSIIDALVYGIILDRQEKDTSNEGLSH